MARSKISTNLVASVLLVAAFPAHSAEMVRIAVAIGTTRTNVSGAGLAVVPLRENAPVTPVTEGAAEVTLEGNSLLVNGAPIDAAGVNFTVRRGPITAGKMSLQGEIEVRRAGEGLVVVNAIPLELYVAAVTGAEMPPSFPPQALRAQAVAARTFAIFKKLEAVAEGRAWHLGATVLHQVYRGGAADKRAQAAAEATAGMVLAYQHVPVEAYFHSSCGGKTESGVRALGRELPYLRPVSCGRCNASPRHRWAIRIQAEEMGRIAGLGGSATDVKVVGRTDSGRAIRVRITGRQRERVIRATDLRQRIGFERLPSLAFDAFMERGEVVFQGKGAGHGAGLCQWGAAGAARAGEDYRTILARYYPGTELVKMY